MQTDTQNMIDDPDEDQEIMDTKDMFAGFDSDDSAESDIDEEGDLPAFPFDEPRTITLKNGTIHTFNIPTLNQEKRKEGIQRTIIITSAAIINGQNPRQIKVDYSKSRLAYYQDVIAEVQGYALEPGDDPNQKLDAQRIIREEPIPGKDKTRKIRLASLIPVTHQRAAVERLYGGKIEIIKPELKDGQKEIVVLNARRLISVKQELGIEQNDDGSFTNPEFSIIHRFREPNGNQLSKWEISCFAGHTINNAKGGSKEERTYDVEACVRLYDSMIDQVEGGSVGGQDCDVRNSEHLAAIPYAIKTQIIAFVMNDVTMNSGN